MRLNICLPYIQLIQLTDDAAEGIFLIDDEGIILADVARFEATNSISPWSVSPWVVSTTFRAGAKIFALLKVNTWQGINIVQKK